MISVGVIGYGYWGPNLVRNFSALADCRMLMISDLSEQRLAMAKAHYPGVETTSDYRDLLTNPCIDAVIIATPVATHYSLALQALRAKKHVFVEKPLTETVEQGERLIEEAERSNLVLHVDHTFIYTGAVRKIRELIAAGELGELYYYDSVRINLGLFQADVNVLWDLAVHDLAIMDYVFPLTPIAVSATGISHVPEKPVNTAFLTLFFDSNVIAHLHVNWLSPVKVRRTLIGGSRKMIAYDDLETSEKVKLYDKGIHINGCQENLYKKLIDYRTGDIWAPHLDITEALQVEVQHFLSCINGRERSSSDGQAGVRVVSILEAATQSLNQRGRPVELDVRVAEC